MNITFCRKIFQDDIFPSAFVEVTEINDSYFISCKNGSVYEMSNLESCVLQNCVTSDDGSISLPGSVADTIKLNRIFQDKSFNNVKSAVIVSESTIVESNDNQLNFSNHQTKVTFPESYQGVKKFIYLNSIL